VRHPYGPRWIGSYDFHAGIDIPVGSGAPVHAIRAGTVWDVLVWDGVATAGNRVIVQHADDWFSAYLHLDSIGVDVGDSLAAGEVLGTAGSTGASYDHLHLGLMRGLTTGMDERRSRNPLELLPHEQLPAGTATPTASGFDVELSVQSMRVQSIELSNATQTRFVDYLDVVALGSFARDEHSQFGVWLDAAAVTMTGGSFALAVRPDPPDFNPDTLRVWDFDGVLILEVTP
jgi:murein DD-endopeptidase MepM/ murein hydrolase activator NlpD